MNLRCRLKIRENKLYLTYSWYMDDKPIKVTQWWDTGLNLNLNHYLIGQEADLTPEGAWRPFISGEPTRFLPEGGKQKADFIDKEEVPPPRKSKSETRWHDGGWERYNNRKGWVPASSGKKGSYRTRSSR